jgi:hypothetical protein
MRSNVRDNTNPKCPDPNRVAVSDRKSALPLLSYPITVRYLLTSSVKAASNNSCTKHRRGMSMGRNDTDRFRRDAISSLFPPEFQEITHAHNHVVRVSICLRQRRYLFFLACAMLGLVSPIFATITSTKARNASSTQEIYYANNIVVTSENSNTIT